MAGKEKEFQMKILVIDDTKKHLDAALQTLVGHDVTVCSTHDEALRLLEKQYDNDKQKQLLEKYEQSGMKNREAWDKSYLDSELPYWDAVLCDLLMPAGRNAQGGEGTKFIGQEMPVGWSLALQAAREGAKYVAVVTDMNHHHHPASAMLDGLNRHIFSIDNARLLMTNHIDLVGIIGSECACKQCNGTGKKRFDDGRPYDCHYCTNGIDFADKGKNWNSILVRLTGEVAEDE
jgi:CheY-like chemotaxis protein